MNFSKTIKKYYNEHKNERKEYRKIYQKENKNEISEYQKNYREEHKNDNEWKEYHKNYSKKWNQDNKERVYEKHKKYNEEHKDELTEYYKKWEENNKEKRKEQHKIYDAQKCIDPIEGDECTYGVLRTRKYRNKEKYKDIVPSEYIIKINNTLYMLFALYFAIKKSPYVDNYEQKYDISFIFIYFMLVRSKNIL